MNPTKWAAAGYVYQISYDPMTGIYTVSVTGPGGSLTDTFTATKRPSPGIAQADYDSACTIADSLVAELASG